MNWIVAKVTTFPSFCKYTYYNDIVERKLLEFSQTFIINILGTSNNKCMFSSYTPVS